MTRIPTDRRNKLRSVGIGPPPEGVKYHSPGSRPTGAHPGFQATGRLNLAGVVQALQTPRDPVSNPFRVEETRSFG